MARCFIILLIITVVRCSPTNYCSKFKKGVYVYAEGPLKGYKVHRKRNEQIEYLEGVAAIFYVKWVSECTYLLVAKSLISKGKTDALQLDTIKVEIIRILSDSSYMYEANMKGNLTRNILVKLK